MALDKKKLADAIKTTFIQAKTNQWDEARVAQSLADAIDAYVQGAEVVAIKTDPQGAQIGTGKIQ